MYVGFYVSPCCGLLVFVAASATVCPSVRDGVRLCVCVRVCRYAGL